MNAVIRNFDAAAAGYDRAALMQSQVASALVAWAKTFTGSVGTVLDIGCGTGLVSEAVFRQWPQADLTALDPSPTMLQQATRKIPHLKTIVGQASDLPVLPKYDLIVSSMMLHWLPHPAQILQSWQQYLKPGGHICAALLIEGSFSEWRDLCRQFDLTDGMWVMPSSDVIDALPGSRRQQQAKTISYGSAHDFLRRLKETGAATPRADYSPLPPGTMRKLLTKAPRPFDVTYQILYVALEMPSHS